MTKATLECTTVDPEIFFSDDAMDRAQAEVICNRCPVRIECRDRAREGREWGFWGGESEEARKAFLTGAPEIPKQLRRKPARPAKFRYRRNWTNDDMLECHRLHAEGMTYRQIAKEFIDPLTGDEPHYLDVKHEVYKWRLRMGIPSPKEHPPKPGVYITEPRDLEMLHLHHVEGLEYKAIAVLYNMKPSAVKQAVFRVKQRMKKREDNE